MPLSRLEILELWYRALATDEGVGIVVECEDIEALRSKLYIMRQEAGDPSLEVLSLITSPSTPNQLWIVVTKKEVPDAPDR